jgi:hypothetical protein
VRDDRDRAFNKKKIEECARALQKEAAPPLEMKQKGRIFAL